MRHITARPSPAHRPLSVALMLAFGACGTAQAQHSDPDSTTAPVVEVTGILPSTLESVPGSSSEITQREITRIQPPTIKEVLRQVPGVHVVDEDALGLNLNIGVRGLNPRRTQRTLLLEDGMPIHLAPYSDPTAHYHPPSERVARVEVLKGSGEIIHGPQTVGGVINFITRRPPAEREAQLRMALGNRSFGSVYGRFGTGDVDKGVMLDFAHKQGDGSRDNYEHKVSNAALSGRVTISDSQRLFLTGALYRERSKTGEWGLTDAAFDDDPYGNPFDHDRFELDRMGGQVLHEIDLSESLIVSTRVYAQRTDRVSYRQIDASYEDGEIARMQTGAPGSGCTSSAQRRDYSNAANCGNKQRPREYMFWGVEPRVNWFFSGLGAQNHLVAGIRYHTEDVERRRYNGLFADAREDTPGTLLRDLNTIDTEAWSGFVQNTFTFGAFAITPGVRVEHVKSKNTAEVADFADDGRSISESETEVLPGLGVTYQAAAGTTLFAGVHRGFAPPRPDANLSPVDPDLVPVSAEKSVNYEIGVRTTPRPGMRLEATLFRIDFDNQIVPGASVGLPAQTFANAGETVHQGIELGARLEFPGVLPTRGTPYLSAAYTYLADAKFASSQFNGTEDVKGNRLPYAPRNLLSASVGYMWPMGLDVRVGLDYIDEQFSDDLNTKTPDGSGLVGRIPSSTTYNFTVNYQTKRDGLLLFLSGTNLTDETYIVSRVDGIQVSRPRTIMGGIDWTF